MTTIRLTMAQALLRFLDQQYISCDGVETKFVAGVMGIFGHGNVTGLGEALERSSGSLNFIQGKNEQGMAHAATAFAKQHNRKQIYACTTSIGPGALNMVTAAGTATVNRIPLLLLPGDNFASRQPDPVLQQLEAGHDYTISAADAFKPVSRFWDRIVRPEQLMTSALNAIRVLTDPAETGAVTLALPQDVQAEAYDYPASFFEKRVHYVERQQPAPQTLERAIALVKSKRKPMIVAGGGVKYSEATKALAEFAEKFGIPVSETQAGKGSLPWNHPLNVGGVGVTGALAANKVAKEADLIIGIGTRYSDFTTSSKSAFHPEAQFLNININRMDGAKLDGVAVTGDAKTVILQLLEGLSAAGYSSSYTDGQITELGTEWKNEVDRLYELEHPEGFAQTRALGVINETIGDEAVIVCAAGSLPGDLHRLWRVGQPKGYHMEYGFSCMGYEVSGAFGVALAEPERDVYAFVGDGSYLMLHSELVTSLQEGRKITVLLFDNHGYQCIHNLQRGHGSDGFGNEFRYREQSTGRYTGAPLPIDFSAHARSLGAAAYKATTPEELEQALKSAKEETRTTLIEIPVLAGTNTDGYESWWNVGVPAVSSSTKVTDAHQAMNEKLSQARVY
ncbi:3D-(3,5/4)-trihydroxycyclohexane-1,2-dione acylhydrolase (decyclizing) [Bacillus sp. FJAT-27264]|uniref:3D-(3,5/4)-trihydroxycyclohexane-1,2-dione acylhydrolase (decyclizing) n=1 Tax=Paenibacillus sp. (strain DSM 101736 / FJAT-27264) TaxID=1850362 RepID=UPI0008081276|nr:3D-(3,5/4)-trihydroxycyclohexane-1,2-dione acylhydrolase (decyclizing) [Bacillus sp. FJAT-27264]OBZ18613.1 3D-(3,5/4)-trihydroxycyclohexane-1,2-dione acylhydrolase (decyclizing) [Bacillus sp. FJAT-27264]